SRMMQKVHDTLANPVHGGHAGSAQPQAPQAPTGNQTVPNSGQMTPDQVQQSAGQSLQSSPWGAQIMAMLPSSIQPGARPLTPEQQRESDMHNGLLQMFHEAWNQLSPGEAWAQLRAEPGKIPGELGAIAQIPGAVVTLPGRAIGKAVDVASGWGPVQQAIVGDSPSDQDLRKLAPDADATGTTGTLALLFPKESAQLKAEGYSDHQIEAAIMEALRASPDIKKIVTQSDIGVNIEGALLLGLEAQSGLTALDALKATKAIAGDAIKAQLDRAAEFANPKQVAYAMTEPVPPPDVPPPEAVPDAASRGAARVAWAHIAATVAAGRK